MHTKIHPFWQWGESTGIMKRQNNSIPPSYLHPRATVTTRGHPGTTAALAPPARDPQATRSAQPWALGCPARPDVAVTPCRRLGGCMDGSPRADPLTARGHWGRRPALVFMSEAATNIHTGVSLNTGFRFVWVTPTCERWALGLSAFLTSQALPRCFPTRL